MLRKIIDKIFSCDIRIFILLLFVIGLAGRIIALLMFGNWKEPEFEYLAIAENIYRGLGYSYDYSGPLALQPTALFPPIYIYWCYLFILLGSKTFLNMYIGQTILAASGVMPAYLAGKNFFSKQTGRIIAIIYSIFPEIVFLPLKPTPEFLYVVFFLWIMYLFSLIYFDLVKNRLWLLSISIGLLSGIFVLIKIAGLIIFISLFCTLLLVNRLKMDAIKNIYIPMLLALFIVLAPWLYRNYVVFDKIFYLRTGFGYNIWIGNNAYSLGTTRMKNKQPLNPFLQEKFRDYFDAHMGDTEMSYMDFMQKEGMQYIKEHKMHYLQLCLKRLYYYWWRDTTHPLTGRPEYFYPYFVILVFGLGGIYIAFRHRKLYIVFILTMLGYMALYIPVVMLPRYRIIQVVILIMYGSYFIEQLLNRTKLLSVEEIK